MEGRSVLWSLLLVVVLLFCRAQANSAGPPVADNFDRICRLMLPNHSNNQPQEGNGGYLIATNLPLNDDNTGFSYTAGQTYTVTVTGTDTFRGFLVIAHVPGQNEALLGRFIPEPGNNNQQILACDPAGASNEAAIAHSNLARTQTFLSVQFTWQAPDGTNGIVNFRYTVVQSFFTFFVLQNAALNGPPPTPATPTPPVRAPEEYQLTFRTPEGCNVSNCTTFVGVDVNEGNGGFLDIYMEGQALGWVAVGFTEEPDIFSADVVACNRIPLNDSVEVLDAYNVPSPDANQTTLMDPSQDVFLFNGTFIDGRIICTVAKQITPVDPFPQDIDLSLNLYVLYGVQMAEGTQGMILNNATDIFEISPTPVNPVTGEVVTVPMREPEDYQLTFRTPPGCNVSNCTSFIGVDVNEGNGGFLDIYMEGDALGWVAVGFSESRNMSLADVVACAVNPNTNMVEGLDTYNVPMGRNNVIDEINNVVFFNSSFNESRIFCSVSKLITPREGLTQDLDLNSFYYVMWGIRPAPRTMNGSIQPHAIGQDLSVALSANLVQPVDGTMIQAPDRAPEDYRLTFRSPANCQPASCDIYVGIDTNAGNNEFLDIYMEAETAGWVAVGFSLTRNMFNADVIGCSLDPAGSGMVEAVDTYNPNARANSLDSIQDITRFSSSASNGRISCVVSKQIAPSGGNEDLNLNDPNLYVMYGIGPDASGAGALSEHNNGAGNPILSTRTFNPATSVGDGSNNFPMGALLRAHGILMLIAWPLLAVSGIFFAAWMRPALPNGEWFQIHRAFLLTSLFVGALGFILAFVAHARNPTPGLINDLGTSTNSVGTAHYIIGIIVMFMHILNPLIAICRCHPGEKYRWVFNLLHGTTIGLLAEILALVNIALGLVRFGPSSFFRDSNDLTIFWVYIAYFIFILVVIGLLFLIFTILSLFNRDEDGAKTAPSLIKPLISSSSGGGKHGPLGEGVELAVPGQKPAAPVDEPEKPKVPSKDSPLRWGALTIFLTVNVIMMLVLLILIALE